jgi:hypothetical protein
MSKALILLSALAFAFQAEPAIAAVGNCTMQADGAIGGGDVVWGAPSGDCRDLGDGCGGSNPDCPDSDDLVFVNGHVLTVDQDTTVNRLLNTDAGGSVTVTEDVTFRVENPSKACCDVWSCPSCAFIAEPGATLEVGMGDNSITASQEGRVIIQGEKVADVTFDDSTGGCSGTPQTLKTFVFTDPVAGAAPGDLIMVTSGLARGYTFEIDSVDSQDPTRVTVDLSKRDPYPLCSSGFASPDGSDERLWMVDGGGPDFVAQDDEAYLGKFLLIDGEYRLIVAVTAGTAERDTFVLYSPHPAPSSTAFEMAYGFEKGSDTAVIYRPVRWVNVSPSDCAGGGTRQCSFSMRQQDGSRTTWEYADVEGIGVWWMGVDANPPSEFAEARYLSFHDQPATYPSFVYLGPAANPSKDFLLEWVDIFNYAASPAISATGDGNRIRNVMIRDQDRPYGTASGSGIGVAKSGNNRRVTIEDVTGLRVANLLNLGTNDERPNVIARRVWCLGRQSNMASQGCIRGQGINIDPSDTSDGKNDGRQRIWNSVLMGTKGSLHSLPGRSIGQAHHLINTLGAYAGFHNCVNCDMIYRGESWHTVAAYNGRHGQSDGTYTLNSIAYSNTFMGIASLSEFCVPGTCCQSAQPRLTAGNLAFKNGRSPYNHQDESRDNEVHHNTLVGHGGLYDSGAAFNPSNDPYPTESNPGIACGNGECAASSGQRCAWWEPAPDEPPDSEFYDNVVVRAGTAAAAGLGIGGTYLDDDDLDNDYNYYSNWLTPVYSATPGPNSTLYGTDPFVDIDADDYRLSLAILGSDGLPIGASIAGIVSGPEAMPPIYQLLLDAGEFFTFRAGDWIFSMDPDEDGTANISDFAMTEERVTFEFPSAPALPPNACQNPTDRGETCGTLKLKLVRPDGSVVKNYALIPIQGSGDTWSVAESAFVLLFGGIEDEGNLWVSLEIGETESPIDVWPMSEPYGIPRYRIPFEGGNDPWTSTWVISGTALGGRLDFVVEGEALQVITTPGQTAVEVAAAVAAEINNDPELVAAGVTATAVGNQVTTHDGEIAAMVSNDPGISALEGAIPALSLPGLLVFLLLVTAGMAHRVRRRRPLPLGGA